MLDSVACFAKKELDQKNYVGLNVLKEPTMHWAIVQWAGTWQEKKTRAALKLVQQWVD